MPVTDASYSQLLRESFGGRAAEVAAAYPASEYGSARLAWSAMDTDRVWSCTRAATTKAFSQYRRSYAYEFTDPNAPGYVPFPEGFRLGHRTDRSSTTCSTRRAAHRTN